MEELMRRLGRKKGGRARRAGGREWKGRRREERRKHWGIEVWLEIGVCD